MMDGKIASTFTKSALLVAVAGILSRGTGLLREVVFASCFGSHEDFDIYLAGTVLPFIINTSIFYIAQNYLIPLFNAKSGNQSQLVEIANQNFKFFVGIGFILLFILLLLKNFIIKNYLWSSSIQVKQLAENIYIITLFTIPLNAGYSVLAAFYQSRLQFEYPSILPVVQNIFVIIVIILGNKFWGIYSIPIGYLSGYLLQFLIVTVLYGIKKLVISNTTPYRPHFGFNQLFITITMIEIINQLYLFIDRYFLNYIQTGGIAALNYSSVLFSLPINILSVSIAVVAFPIFSDMIELDKIKVLKKYFNRILTMITGIFILITVMYYFAGRIIIDLVYKRGSFTSHESVMVYEALKMYSISLVFYAMFSVIYKMMFSLGLSRLLLLFTGTIFIVKIILNILFVKEFNYSGLALSTSISYILITISCYFAVVNKIQVRIKKIYVS